MSKKEGKIFTPDEIVCFMIDQVGYTPGHNVIDNSCGDGQILSEIVKRNIYCFSGNDLKYELETHIHGVEIDPETHAECIRNLNQVLKDHGISLHINWDIRCGDSLAIRDFDGEMDYSIANPPYIRTKDLVAKTDGYEFMESGMVDLYLAFFELGFRQLNKTGRMIYIAPSSWYTSEAGQVMRNYIYSKKNLSDIWDFCHRQVFENAQTYVSITMFSANKVFESISFNEVEISPEKEVKVLNTENIPYVNAYIKNKFYFGSENTLKCIKSVLDQDKMTPHIKAKNGYATLCDGVFIGDFDKESDYIIPVVKASTGGEKTCIYPYDKDGKVISEKELKETSPIAYKWLSDNRDKLVARKTDEPWYAFGRTQALNDTLKKKFSMKSLVKTVKDLKLKEIESGTGVYGGLYIIADDEKYLNVCQEMMNEDFLDFVRSLRKYKSGGYYTFSSKDFNAYATYFIKTRI